MEFGDTRKGTATVVEVKEMDLSDFHESASSFSSLPALPKVDHTKISKKRRNPNAGGVHLLYDTYSSNKRERGGEDMATAHRNVSKRAD